MSGEGGTPPLRSSSAALGPAARGALWAIFLFVVAVAGLVPLRPTMPNTGLDNAWSAAMGAAVAGNLAFGRDLIFTFGPYAGIYTWTYHPATDGLVLGGTFLLAAALTVGLLHLTRDRGRWAALLLVLLLPQMWLRDPNLFIIPLVFLAVVCHGAPTSREPALRAEIPILALMTVALGLLPLVKGTLVAASGLALGLGGLLLLFRGWWRTAFGLAALFLVTLATSWLLAGGALPDLPRFFLAQGEIIRGYTPAMSLEGPLWEVAVFAAAAAAILLLNLPDLRALLARRGIGPAVLWLGAAAMLFLGFKAGFVRQDEHVAIAGGVLALVACVLATARAGGRPVAGVAAALVGWFVLDTSASGAGLPGIATRFQTSAEGFAAGIAARLRPGTLPRTYEERLADLRRENPLPPITGRADIYSTGQTALLAHGARWSPRPILQSYSTYTPRLAALNAAHLAGPAAPDTVLLAVEPIDSRLAAHEDGLSWPAFLTRYEVAGLQGSLAALRRRPDAPPRPADPGEGLIREVVATGRHTMGERVPLPAAPDALWATISVKETLLGRAMSALFRSPTVAITLDLPGGRVLRRRFIPGAGEAGFLLAPLVEDVRGLLALGVPGAPVYADLRPLAFTLSAEPAGLWRGDYTLELRRFAPGTLPGAAEALLRRPAPADPAPEGGRCWLDAADGTVVDHTRPLVLGRQVRLTGFAYPRFPAPGSPGGREPEAISIAFTAPDGRVTEARADITLRPDVGRTFGQPELSRIGFLALLDLGALRGAYRVSATLDTPAGRQSCSLYHDFALIGGE